MLLLCAAALLYGPVPYEFLHGADVDQIDIVAPDIPGAPKNRLRTRYRMEGGFDDALTNAKRELKAEDGWVWTFPMGKTHIAKRPATKEMVYFSESLTATNGGGLVPGPVMAFVFKKATPLDRIHAWLHDR